MVKDYTMEEIRHMYETNPAQVEKEYKACCKATSELAERARAGIAARKFVPQNRVQALVQTYAEKFIYTNSVKPLVHMILITGVTGIALEYLGHHRHKNRKNDH